MNHTLSVRRFMMALLALALSLPAFAATTTVTNLADLRTRIAAAQPGDTIILSNGVYAATASINVTCTGEAGRPITIAAESVGGVEINGTAGFVIKNPAAHVIVSGFKFTHNAGQTKIEYGAQHVRLQRNIFACVNSGTVTIPFLSITADDTEIAYNEFRDKNTIGNMISLYGYGSSTQVARRAWIHHNHFHDFMPAEVNGAETIRYGVSGVSMSRGDGIIEHNLFERCIGELELISNKSCGNTYRYNTFIDSPGAQLTLRQGNDCAVYGNSFRNTSGLRIFGDRQLVHSNYFERCDVAITLGNGDAEIGNGTTGADLGGHDRPDNAVIAFNTIVSSTCAYSMDGRSGGLGATNSDFANNIIVGSATLMSIAGPNTGATWAGNVYWDVAMTGTLPPSGFAFANPQLAPGPHGVCRPAAASPIAGTAAGSYPKIEYDMDGQLRPATGKTPGADEPRSDSAITARFLTPADVGPFAGAPVIASLFPFSFNAGSTVVIKGSNFSAVTGVYFGGVAAASFTVDSSAQITAVAPAGFPVPGRITVTTLNGSHTSDTMYNIGATLFPSPVALVFDSAGNLLVADDAAHSILKISPQRALTTLAGVTGEPGTTDGARGNARLDCPSSLAVSPSGELFVADAGSGRIRKVAANGYVTTLASGLASPGGLAFDSEGNLLAADSGGHVVRQIAPNGTSVIRYGAHNEPGAIAATGTLARFNTPTHLLVDGAGHLYIADTGNHVIRTLAADGTVLIYAGFAGTSGTADGFAPDARLNAPRGMASDSANNLYFADTGNSTIRMIDADSGVVRTLAGSPGTRGLRDGSGTAALFDRPRAVVCDTAGNLYIADTGNHAIRRLVLATGQVTTLVVAPGMETTGGAADPGGAGGGALSFWHLSALAALAIIARTRRGRAAKDPSSRSRTSLQLRFGVKHKNIAACRP